MIQKVVLGSLTSWRVLMTHQRITLILFLFVVTVELNAQSFNSPNLARSTISVSGASEKVSINNKEYILQQSVGQASSISTFFVNKYTVRQGFIQPNVLTGVVGSKQENLDVLVYPNPFVATITLAFSDLLNGEVLISIYDQVGHIVYMDQHYVNDHTLKIDLPEMARTLYILKIHYKNTQFIRQLIKQ